MKSLTEKKSAEQQAAEAGQDTPDLSTSCLIEEICQLVEVNVHLPQCASTEEIFPMEVIENNTQRDEVDNEGFGEDEVDDDELFQASQMSYIHPDLTLEIMASVDNKWAACYNAGDFAGVSALYSRDGLLMAPGGPAVPKKDMVAFLSAYAASGYNRVRIMPEECVYDAGSNHGVEKGYHVFSSADGVREQRGKHVVLWRLEDGEWKLCYDSFSPDS